MSDQFRQWLVEEMKKRRYSQAALARAIGISQPFVSRVLRGQKPVSVDFCQKVAQALGESPEKVLRLAGILPETNEDDPALREINDLAKRMTPAQRVEALRYLRYLCDRRRHRPV